MNAYLFSSIFLQYCLFSSADNYKSTKCIWKIYIFILQKISIIRFNGNLKKKKVSTYCMSKRISTNCWKKTRKSFSTDTIQINLIDRMYSEINQKQRNDSLKIVFVHFNIKNNSSNFWINYILSINALKKRLSSLLKIIFYAD